MFEMLKKRSIAANLWYLSFHSANCFALNKSITRVLKYIATIYFLPFLSGMFFISPEKLPMSGVFKGVIMFEYNGMLH
jgi:hypothetical protein